MATIIPGISVVIRDGRSREHLGVCPEIVRALDRVIQLIVFILVRNSRCLFAAIVILQDKGRMGNDLVCTVERGIGIYWEPWTASVQELRENK